MWFTAGAGAGMAGSAYLRRKLRRVVRRSSSAGVGYRPNARLRASASEARAALAEGKAAVQRYRADAARRAASERSSQQRPFNQADVNQAEGR